MKKVIFIKGMQCNHCKESVKETLAKLDGVEKVEVNLEQKKAEIETTKLVEDKKIKQAIDDIGFEVSKIEEK